jgi:hypothetical protein
MTPPSEFGRFLAWSTLTITAGVLACVALVVLVDPYGLYRVVERPGFNRVKAQPQRYQSEIKLAGARATGAKLFIVGNSRAEIGLDPDAPALATAGLAPYNLALAGTRIQTGRGQLALLRQQGQRASHLIVGAEFLDFPIDSAAAEPAERPLPSPDRRAELAWRFDTLFSLDSVIDAAKTVRAQRNPDAPRMTAHGYNPLLEYRQMARSEGYHALFRQRAADYAQRFSRAPHGLLAGNSGSSREFDSMRALLADGLRDGARIDIVIYPYHAQIMALLESAGLDSVFDQWKGLMAREVDALRAQHPGARITLWDFSGYAPYQCEPIPAKGDRKAQTQWYWEAGHFKAALGNIMLARIMEPAPGAAQFGTVLSSDALAANRARLAAERAQCLASNPALFTDAAKLIRR